MKTRFSTLTAVSLCAVLVTGCLGSPGVEVPASKSNGDNRPGDTGSASNNTAPTMDASLGAGGSTGTTTAIVTGSGGSSATWNAAGSSAQGCCVPDAGGCSGFTSLCCSKDSGKCEKSDEDSGTAKRQSLMR